MVAVYVALPPVHAAASGSCCSARLQLVSAAAFSLGHGANDAQKTMGIIAALLYSDRATSPASSTCPLWVDPRCYGAIGLGTLLGRLAHREDHGHEHHRAAAGRRLLRRDRGRALACSRPALRASRSRTTHTITGAIVGVGVSATQRLSAVKWGVAGRIVWAWVLTMPIAAIIAAAAWFVAHALGMK